MRVQPHTGLQAGHDVAARILLHTHYLCAIMRGMRTIELTQGQVALVDDEMFDELSRYKWQAHWAPRTKSFYAVRTVGDGKDKKTINMHRVVVGAVPGNFVDHINHETLDNRQENLRILTNRQNLQNQRTRKHSSRFKGVSYNKSRSTWDAIIREPTEHGNGVLRTIGRFRVEEQAALAYDAAARTSFGAYAALNFPGPGEVSALRNHVPPTDPAT